MNSLLSYEQQAEYIIVERVGGSDGFSPKSCGTFIFCKYVIHNTLTQKMFAICPNIQNINLQAKNKIQKLILVYLIAIKKCTRFIVQLFVFFLNAMESFENLLLSA